MVTGKQLATYSLHHHGDGKVALLLNASIVLQHMLVDAAPDIFFKPPYVGHKGWVGVELNKGLKWPRIQQLTYEAYVRTASNTLAKEAQVPDVPAPTQKLKSEDIHPLLSTANQQLVKKIEKSALLYRRWSGTHSLVIPATGQATRTSALLLMENGDPTCSFGLAGMRRVNSQTRGIGLRPTWDITVG
jgi:hypothetical protein